MRRWLNRLPIILGLLFLHLTPALAEGDKKPLEQILLDKGILTADEAASVQAPKLPKWVDRLSLSGDVRLRYEGIIYQGPLNKIDRHRERFRLRLASEYKVNDFTVGVRLASGVGQQTSTNQSFSNLFTEKPLFIDRAYLQWKGMSWLTVTGGKMANPFFWINSTDVVWDDDVNPEGFAENFNLKLSDELAVFANLGQLVLSEISGITRDQWLFGEQVGVEVKPMPETKATVAAAFYGFRNATVNDFAEGVVQDGNTRAGACAAGSAGTAGCALASPFRVLDITAEVATKVAGLPIALQGDYVQNLSAKIVAPKTRKEDMGYQLGVRLGKAGAPQTWELAYFYKLLETDATVADLAESDFGDNGGTNRKGHVFWGAYNFTSALQLKTKMYRSATENEELSPNKKDIVRVQVDLLLKF